MNDIKATLAVLTAGFTWGIISLFAMPLSRGGLDSMQVAGVRMISAGLSCLIFMLCTNREGLRIHLRDLWMFFCSGIVSTIMYAFCYFYSMSHGQSSIAIVLLYTSTIFVIIMFALFFREPITKRKLIACILTFIGCVFVSGMLNESIHVTTMAIIAGIGSGFFYALYSVFGHIALKKYSSLTVTTYTFLFALLGSLVISRPLDSFTVMTANPVLFVYALGIGIICSVIPVYFYTYGLEHMEAGKAAILVAIEPIVGALLGMTVFHEDRNPMKLLGIALVITAIFILNGKEKSAR